MVRGQDRSGDLEIKLPLTQLWYVGLTRVVCLGFMKK